MGSAEGGALTRRNFLLASATVAGGAALTLAGCSSSTTQSVGGGGKTSSPFNLNLGFTPAGRDAPFYYGQKLGLYADSGVNLTIASASSTTAALQLLSAGKADAGLLGSAALLQLMGQTPNPMLKSYATIFQKDISTIFFLKGKGIETPKDLEGKTISTSAGANEKLLFPAFAAKNGIDAAKVTWEVVSPTVKTGLILTGTVDASSTTLFGLAQLQSSAKPGQEIGYFTYGDYGVPGNPGVIGALADYGDTTHATLMKSFIEASMESYKRSFANPDAAVDAMHEAVPTLDVSIAREEMNLLENIAVGQPQKDHGIGWNDPATFSVTADMVKTYFDVTLPKPSDDYFSNAYLGTVQAS